jgi:ABC-type transport system involved in multi-copper enzyme maturation permease subunit
MITCVFHQEMMLAGRRQRAHFLRWIYAAFVVAQIIPFFITADSLSAWLNGGGFSAFLEPYVVLHFGLIALLTPALVGSAITEEKTSGTLQYLLTAYLSPWEIVLGKLCARSYQLVLMSLIGLPLICFLSGFAGVGSLPLAILILSLALIFGLASVSMLASVWSRQTRDALLGLYLLALAFIAIGSLATWPKFAALAATMNPLRALTIDDDALRWRRVGDCVLAWSMLSVVCLTVATWRLRGAYLRQLRQVPRPATSWLAARRPRLRANPVAWREQHVVGLVPWPWLHRWPRWLGCVLLVTLTLCSYAWFLQQALPAGLNLAEHIWLGRWPELRAALQAAPGTSAVFFWHGGALLMVVSFIVAVRASGCITAEREAGTWQSVLQTPLTTRTIVRGKHWGIFAALAPYLAAVAGAALVPSVAVGASATAWTLVWLLATVLVAQIVSAVGIWCSALCRNSWLSLLATLAIFYPSLLFVGPLAVAILVAKGFVELILEFVHWLVDIGPVVSAFQVIDLTWLTIGLGSIVAFWLLTYPLLLDAERAIARRDRAKDVDPQYHGFHKRWLRKIERTAVPRPIDAALEPLPLHEEVVQG